jgi:hypothetical protein
LINKEVKIKNLLLILNKLLIKSRNANLNKNKTSGDGKLMNDILFDNKIIDLDKGIEFSILEEISQSILKI